MEHEQIANDIIKTLDSYGLLVDPYEYGLPMYSFHVDAMVAIVTTILKESYDKKSV